MLEVAAAAMSGTGVGTRGGDAIGRGSQDLHRVSSQKGRGGGGDPSHDTLTGQGVAHEDHPPVGSTTDGPTTAGDVPDIELEQHIVGVGHSANTRWVKRPVDDPDDPDEPE
jgi:hypothetical protein